MDKRKELLLCKDFLSLFLHQGGIKLYWKKQELTTLCGLNLAINTAGIWSDSSSGEWSIIKRNDDEVIMRNKWYKLPIECIWRLKIERHCFLWDMDMNVEEDLEIDEKRTVILTSSLYTTWFNSYEEGRFPQMIGWQDIPLDNMLSRFVGVRFSKEKLLPPLSLKFEENKFGKTEPVIQNTPPDLNAHIIGVKLIDLLENRCYQEGTYRIFSGKVKVYLSEDELDEEIEKIRKRSFKSEKIRARFCNRKKISVLLVNLPWEKEGKWGVRAGSRWPHIKDESEGNYLPFPFFLAYATSLLRKNDIEADLIDCIAERIFPDDFIELLRNKSFNLLVAETSTPSFQYDMELLQRISYSVDIPIVLCGPHPLIYHQRFLERHDFIDFVMFGEYEVTLLQLVKSLQEKKNEFSSIEGLIWRDRKGNVIKNKTRAPFDINLLPWPYREGLPMERYWDLPGDIPYPSLQIVASRGCPFSCNFCLWPQVLFGGRTYRTRDIYDVVDEMEYWIKNRGFKSVYFDDDTFNIGKERIIELCNEIIKRDLHKIPWAIMAKADLMDEKLLDKLKEAGLHAVKYGIESASQELVDRCGKFLDLKKAERMIKYTQSLGIKVHLTFSFGLPGETKDTIRKTIDYALELNPDSVQFSIITPFPGTRLFEELDREGKILTKDWSLYDGHYSCVFKPDNLTPQELEEAKRYAYRVWADFQRKKRGMWGNIKRFLSCYQKNGVGYALNKTFSYLNYLLFHRRRHLKGI